MIERTISFPWVTFYIPVLFVSGKRHHRVVRHVDKLTSLIEQHNWSCPTQIELPKDKFERVKR